MSIRLAGVVLVVVAAAMASTGAIAKTAAAPPAAPALRTHAPLTEQELDMAKAAWQYFVTAYQPETGLVNSVGDYPSTTLWDTASYISALVSAHELGLIDKPEFDRRAFKLLGTLRNLSLFRGELPNKVYNSKTAEKVDYANKPGEIGYSALDAGRMMIWLRILKERSPYLANSVDGVLLSWNFCHVIDWKGHLFGAAVGDKGDTRYLQEGRLGYLEYAAKGFALWGFNTRPSYDQPTFAYTDIFGVQVPYDERDPRVFHTSNYVLTESYLLDGIELGWDLPNDRDSGPDIASQGWRAEFASRVYLAQARRYGQTGIVTARSEHQVEGAPYFVYDTVFSDGYAWNTLDPAGNYVPDRAAVAAKAALGMWAIWDTPYSDMLFQTVAGIYDPQKGFDEGVYENGSGTIPLQTANNNGIILAALLYKVIGPIMTYNLTNPQVWNTALNIGDGRAAKCLPTVAPPPPAPCGCGPTPPPPPVLKPEDYLLCRAEDLGGYVVARGCSFDVAGPVPAVVPSAAAAIAAPVCEPGVPLPKKRPLS